jgi:hypothetical protein
MKNFGDIKMHGATIKKLLIICKPSLKNGRKFHTERMNMEIMLKEGARRIAGQGGLCSKE